MQLLNWCMVKLAGIKKQAHRSGYSVVQDGIA